MLIKTDIQEIADFYNKIQVAQENYEREISQLSKQLHAAKQENVDLSNAIFKARNKIYKELQLTPDKTEASEVLAQKLLNIKAVIDSLNSQEDLPF